MNLRKVLLSSAAAACLIACGAGIAQHVNPNRHPNLAAAQDLIDQAIGRVTAAQQANEYDMDGHAAKAKELLVQARAEIAMAARAANRNRH